MPPASPIPTGLLATVRQLETDQCYPVIYVGDTVADMYTVENAKEIEPERVWLGVGVLPPHVQSDLQRQEYTAKLKNAGAAVVYTNVQQLTPNQVQHLISDFIQ